MWENFRNVFRIPEVRKRILFTLGIFLVYRVGAYIPIPGINIEALSQSTLFQTGTFGLMNIFAGGALRRMSIFSLGVMPYIMASIIFQLLTIAIPRLEEIARQGEEGRQKINQWTRYFTIPIAVIQGLGLIYMVQSMNEGAFVFTQGALFIIPGVITLVTGTIFDFIFCL